MSPWFERRQTESVPVSSVHYVSAIATIRATRSQVWNFIKPAENSVLVDPEVVRGFSTPGTDGKGEIQVFISVRDGAESVSAIEVEHEVPYELAVTRTLGDPDPSARSRDFLQDAGDDATILEHGLYFTWPGEAAGYFSHYEHQYRLHCQQYVERVKAVMERDPISAATVQA
ncbi:hypothetical protein NG697_00820 [Pseudarthrobacter sp. MDT3-26]|uniref:hypothetical protein n=1 Tax=Pseudarthrobacter raffinosi TaxID=2953651 RepID=UPI00208E0A58|nr:hypothetical protein [Pseudarthrobacter sp. MDT3-26]MCO4261495.1 hypothetical protein [Pseudarthrobacter sp. MDT3-26]